MPTDAMRRVLCAKGDMLRANGMRRMLHANGMRRRCTLTDAMNAISAITALFKF